jgi:hypothetical protein
VAGVGARVLRESRAGRQRSRAVCSGLFGFGFGFKVYLDLTISYFGPRLEMLYWALELVCVEICNNGRLEDYKVRPR